jgi:tricorn protease
MLVHADKAYSIIELPLVRMEITNRLDLSGMKVDLDRAAEWKQIYRECWRQMRDFVYASNMQGVDWRKERERYEPLLPYVNHRADLTYVIGEMIGELNLGHTYVGGGDYPRPRRIEVGLLGAKIERDPASGAFRVARILRGENWDPQFRSPLTEIGVNVNEGDYIVAVDGRPAAEIKNLYAALVDTTGKQITLRVNSQPKLEGSRETVVVPIADERPLYYLNWVLRNIERVTKATDGKVAYVHIPNMEPDGLNEFVKLYYPQLNKEALIVDVRGNGGGNVSPQIVERLRREMALIVVARNAAPRVDPAGMILGPKVMLLDEFSASDGDIVAYRFQKHKLGPVIGKRSWGGAVGIRRSRPLLDGGTLSRPEFARYDNEGKQWIIEGTGIVPDIVVDNDPAREFAGIDDQLERGIEVVKKLLAEHPVRVPPPPPFPDKSK